MKKIGIACLLLIVMTLGTTVFAAADEVVIEFAQWWEGEMGDGVFRAIIDEFEAQNPGVRVELLSSPFASMKEQLIAGAASGTMPDVMGLDGSWVNDFVKQGSLANLSELMAQCGYDAAQLSDEVQVNGATYMIPVVNFTYPLFINKDIMDAAGVTEAPRTRSEFFAAAKAMTDPDKNISGWGLPLSMDLPNGVQNDIMNWLWMSGKHMLKDGKPDLLNGDVKELISFIQEMYDAGVIAPGAFSMKAPDRVAEFSNGRLGMMISSLSHINVVRKNNPDLNFILAAVPVADGYEGEKGIAYASWGIGVSAQSQHPEIAWKLAAFIMDQDVNARLAAQANAFPGNRNATLDLEGSNELFKAAYELYRQGELINEFNGLPVSEELMRVFDEYLQLALSGQMSVDEMLSAVQDNWTQKIG